MTERIWQSSSGQVVLTRTIERGADCRPSVSWRLGATTTADASGVHASTLSRDDLVSLHAAVVRELAAHRPRSAPRGRTFGLLMGPDAWGGIE